MQRTLASLGAIQRAIVARAALPEVLDAIVAAAGELLGDENPALFLIDPDDPQTLQIAAHRVPDDVYPRIRRRPIGEGVAGRATVEDRVVAVEDYHDTADGTVGLFRDRGLTAAMAAPIHDEDGAVLGCLLVSTYRPGRRYAEAERDVLVALADHVSLALAAARMMDAMADRALRDPLTGLPNRLLLADRLEHAADRARRSGTQVALLFCDLDGFKQVNDAHGHEAGDAVLREVARRLEGCLRSGDTAARLGGDEFVVLLEDLEDVGDAQRVADRVLAALAEPHRIDGTAIAAPSSIGIAMGADHIDLLGRADGAMYRAKADGGGTAVTAVGLPPCAAPDPLA